LPHCGGKGCEGAREGGRVLGGEAGHLEAVTLARGGEGFVLRSDGGGGWGHEGEALYNCACFYGGGGGGEQARGWIAGGE
jgi:hypothetical protein